MTLVIAVLTQNYVILASDRRISRPIVDPTSPRGFRIEARDSDIKTVTLDHRYLLGFSGIARINDFRMEATLVEWLEPPVPSIMYFETIRDRIQEYFDDKQLFDMNVSHAFVGAGFVHDPRGNRWITESTMVSNSFDSNDEYSNVFISRNFRVVTKRLFGNRPTIRTVGAEIPTLEYQQLQRALIKATNQHPRDPQPMFQPMIRALRATAAINPTVSKEMILSSLPRVAVPIEASSTYMGVPTDFTQAEFNTTITAGSEQFLRGMQYTPAFIRPDGANSMAGVMRIGPGPIEFGPPPAGYFEPERD